MSVSPVVGDGRRRRASPSLGLVGIALVTGLVLGEAVDARGARGLTPPLRSGWAQLVAPAFVAPVFVAVGRERV